MSKHTPGPWRRMGTNVGDEVGQIATLSFDSLVRMKEPERIANARLIAAAPELLEALKYMINVCPPINQVGEEATMRACIAIAKAEGIS
jgi:hypothetical protein